MLRRLLQSRIAFEDWQSSHGDGVVGTAMSVAVAVVVVDEKRPMMAP